MGKIFSPLVTTIHGKTTPAERCLAGCAALIHFYELAVPLLNRMGCRKTQLLYKCGNDKLKGEQDKDTIGLLLCKGRNEVLAEYALKSYHQPLGVSDYQISKAIPEELESSLPDTTNLEKELTNQELT
jgi:hypothetical protein